MEEVETKSDSVEEDSGEDGIDMRKAARLKRYMKKVVFMVFVEWWRLVGETRTALGECEQAKSRILGCTWGAARKLLRGEKLATIGDLAEWLDVGELGVDWRVVEPEEGQKPEKFLDHTQAYCGRDGSEVWGERIVLQHGDMETHRMMQNSKLRRCGQLAVERLTERIRWYQNLVIWFTVE